MSMHALHFQSIDYKYVRITLLDHGVWCASIALLDPHLTIECKCARIALSQHCRDVVCAFRALSTVCTLALWWVAIAPKPALWSRGTGSHILS